MRRHLTRRSLLALVSGLLVVAALLVLAAPPGAIAAQDATPAVDSATPQLTAILVAATNAPLRVPASDGLEHL